MADNLRDGTWVIKSLNLLTVEVDTRGPKCGFSGRVGERYWVKCADFGCHKEINLVVM